MDKRAQMPFMQVLKKKEEVQWSLPQGRKGKDLKKGRGRLKVGGSSSGMGLGRKRRPEGKRNRLTYAKRERSKKRKSGTAQQPRRLCSEEILKVELNAPCQWQEMMAGGKYSLFSW